MFSSRRPGGAARVALLPACSVVLSCCLLLPCSSAAQAVITAPVCSEAAPLPAAVRLEYAVAASRGVVGLQGDHVLTFSRDAAGNYSMRSDTRSALYNAQQTSRGTLGAGGLVPVEYTERTQRRPQATTRLDWAAGSVSFSRTDEVVPTQPQMQDRLSLLLQLVWRARSRAPAQSHEIPVAGVRGSSLYRFAARGPAAVDLPAGRYEALRFERLDEGGHDRIELWLAPSLCWLPVRLHFEDERGLAIDYELKDARFD